MFACCRPAIYLSNWFTLTSPRDQWKTNHFSLQVSSEDRCLERIVLYTYTLVQSNEECLWQEESSRVLLLKHLSCNLDELPIVLPLREWSRPICPEALWAIPSALEKLVKRRKAIKTGTHRGRRGKNNNMYSNIRRW